MDGKLSWMSYAPGGGKGSKSKKESACKINKCQLFLNFQLTVFLAAVDILGPVAGVGVLIVQQSADAQLFCRSAVPTGPVTRAGRLVAEDAVQPVAMFSSDGTV